MADIIAKNREFWVNCSNSKLGGGKFYLAQSLLLERIAQKYVEPDMTVLDIGCGNGENTKLLSNHCRSITGFDLSENLLAEARSANALTNGGYASLDLEAENWELPAPVDMIFCLGVFTTIHDWSVLVRAVREFNRSLKPEGLLVMRDTLSTGNTRINTKKNGYSGIYRSERHYLRLFEKNGFVRQDFIPIVRGVNFIGFHVFRPVGDAVPAFL